MYLAHLVNDYIAPIYQTLLEETTHAKTHLVTFPSAIDGRDDVVLFDRWLRVVGVSAYQKDDTNNVHFQQFHIEYESDDPITEENTYNVKIRVITTNGSEVSDRVVYSDSNELLYLTLVPEYWNRFVVQKPKTKKNKGKRGTR